MYMYMYKCNYNFFLSPHVVPEDYDYNPHSGKRGDRSHHTELKHSSVEYIAPSEYMVSNSNISYLITCTCTSTCTFLHVHVSDYQSIRHVTCKYEVLVHPRSVDIIYILFFIHVQLYMYIYLHPSFHLSSFYYLCIYPSFIKQVRPPQPSVYFFIIDVSYPAVESGIVYVYKL